MTGANRRQPESAVTQWFDRIEIRRPAMSGMTRAEAPSVPDESSSSCSDLVGRPRGRRPGHLPSARASCSRSQQLPERPLRLPRSVTRHVTKTSSRRDPAGRRGPGECQVRADSSRIRAPDLSGRRAESLSDPNVGSRDTPPVRPDHRAPPIERQRLAVLGYLPRARGPAEGHRAALSRPRATTKQRPSSA
jgi:hypothetical protein